MELSPNFPVVEGTYRMTTSWWVTLPGRFNRRVEDGDLVLWRPGLTVLVAAWGNDHEKSREKRLQRE